MSWEFARIPREIVARKSRRESWLKVLSKIETVQHANRDSFTTKNRHEFRGKEGTKFKERLHKFQEEFCMQTKENSVHK